MQHATNNITPQQPVIDKKFWAMVKETEKQEFVSTLRRFDVDLTVPPDAQRRRLAAVEAPQDDEEEEKWWWWRQTTTTTNKMKMMRIAAARVATQFFVRR
jgi:hypothetical protein